MPGRLLTIVVAELTAELSPMNPFVATVKEFATESSEELCSTMLVVATLVNALVKAKPAPANALLSIETKLTADIVSDVFTATAVPLCTVGVRGLSVLTAGPRTSPTSVQKPPRLENASKAAGTAVDAKLAHDSTALSKIFGAQEVLE